MNLSLNQFVLAATLLLASSAAFADAKPATELLVDCGTRALPSQKAVGEMLGEANFGLVYSARTRLMVEANRACNRPGTSQVRLVLVPDASNPKGRRAAQARGRLAVARR
jgi:hypothetical protein